MDLLWLNKDRVLVSKSSGAHVVHVLNVHLKWNVLKSYIFLCQRCCIRNEPFGPQFLFVWHCIEYVKSEISSTYQDQTLAYRIEQNISELICQHQIIFWFFWLALTEKGKGVTNTVGGIVPFTVHGCATKPAGTENKYSRSIIKVICCSFVYHVKMSTQGQLKEKHYAMVNIMVVS